MRPVLTGCTFARRSLSERAAPMGPIQSKRRPPRPVQVHVEYQPTAHGGWEAVSVSEFTQLALWMAATLAGLVTAVLLARGPFFRALARQVGWVPQETRPG